MVCHVLIPAAGTGRRMACDGNKQYLLLGERPILAHTVARFDACDTVDTIWLISPRDELTLCQQQIVARYGFTKVKQVVAGGETRQDSVRLGLQAMSAEPTDLVVIHDGVRPLFDASQLPMLLDAACPHGAVVGVPVKDTIKQVEQGTITATPERSLLWQVQTPQVFPYGLIRQAHETALAQGVVGTDDASLVERLDRPVAMVRGSYQNLKITTPEDLLVAEALLKG